MENNQHRIINLHDLLKYDAGKFIVAEMQLKKNLHEWINQAGSLQLKAALQKYHDFVDQHIQKLEGFIKDETFSSLSITDHVMNAFLTESNEKIKCCVDVEVKDACLLAGIQTICHFKISLYGSAAAFSKVLEMENAAGVFYEMEINEKYIDGLLSQLAEFEINKRAQAPIVIEY